MLLYFARATQEAELRIVVDYYGTAEDGEVDSAVATGNDGGNAGHFYSILLKFGSRSGHAEHKLDPSRVESIRKRSMVGLDTTTNR